MGCCSAELWFNSERNLNFSFLLFLFCYDNSTILPKVCRTDKAGHTVEKDEQMPMSSYVIKNDF